MVRGLFGKIARRSLSVAGKWQQQQLRRLNIHEYQGAELMSKHGINVPKGVAVGSVDEVRKALQEVFPNESEVVVKSQILAGGRGLGTFKSGLQGGVHIVKAEQVEDIAGKMLGQILVTKQTGPQGKVVSKVYLAEKLSLVNEMYFAITLDRISAGPIIIACKKGGTSIEDLAEKHPELIVKVPIDVFTGITDEDAAKVVDGLSPKVADRNASIEQVKKLYELFCKCDCTLLEINPIAETSDKQLIAADAKLNFDDNAAFRQKEIFALRDPIQEDPREVAAAKADLNYIGLDGEIGCMVNGAGLAMATMDIIKLHGGTPANFLDVGGNASEGQSIHKSSLRNFTTVASVPGKSIQGMKLLVTSGPHAQKAVGIWLFVSAAWVFSMVVLGGVTRLTRSGLSMTDWKFTGGLPPLSDDEWLIEFEKYKQSPEYKRINKGMNLDDFKFIYWMEYAHRMWGRALGIMFALPFSYFLRKGYITLQLGLKLSGLFALGAGQGLIGWWMVKSGLEEPVSEHAEPRVSPYRLAAHLTSAFIIYSGLFWTALSVVMPEPPAESLTWVKGAAKVKRIVLPVSILVGITAISGAFVAGNDAGRAFNTFPKMGDVWIPDDLFNMKPLLRNFFENTATVQLDHRILATATLFSIGGLWWSTRKLDIHPAIRSLLGSTVGMAVLQVTLGISTLLSYVPVSLGSAHQAGALTLLTLMILLNHTLRRPSLHLLKTLPSIAKTA